MATEIIQRRWCDIHLQEKDEQVDAVEWVVTVGLSSGKQQPTMTVDLCADCAEQHLTAVQELVAGFGRRAQQLAPARKSRAHADPVPVAEVVPAGDGSMECPACHSTFADRKRLQSHVRDQHDTILAELEGKVQETTCLVCDPPQTFKSRQAVAIHAGKHR